MAAPTGYADKALLRPCLSCDAEIGTECADHCPATDYARHAGVKVEIVSMDEGPR